MQPSAILVIMHDNGVENQSYFGVRQDTERR